MRDALFSKLQTLDISRATMLVLVVPRQDWPPDPGTVEAIGQAVGAYTEAIGCDLSRSVTVLPEGMRIVVLDEREVMALRQLCDAALRRKAGGR